MLLRDKGLQSSLQKIVTFMFQALVLVHNIVTSVWHIYFCCTALCCLLLCFYSIVTHSKAGNCHFDVSGFYREAKYLHFLPVFDNLIKGTQRQLSAILRPKIENLDPFLVESSPISFFADCILCDTFTEHYCIDTFACPDNKRKEHNSTKLKTDYKISTGTENLQKCSKCNLLFFWKPLFI